MRLLVVWLFLVGAGCLLGGGVAGLVSIYGNRPPLGIPLTGIVGALVIAAAIAAGAWISFPWWQR